MKVIGKMTCNTAQAYKFTVMETSTKECSNKDEETAKEPTITQLVKFTKEVGLMAALKGMEFALGRTTNVTKDSGKTTRNTAKESTLGLMEEATKGTIEATRDTGTGLTLGQTEGNTSVSGRTTRGTEEEHMS